MTYINKKPEQKPEKKPETMASSATEKPSVEYNIHKKENIDNKNQPSKK